MSLFLFLFLLAVSEPGPILSLWFEKPVFWGGAKQRLGFTPQPVFVLTAISWPRGRRWRRLWGMVCVPGVASPGTAGGVGVLVRPSGLRWEERQDDP